jgi:hypothetical protein
MNESLALAAPGPDDYGSRALATSMTAGTSRSHSVSDRNGREVILDLLV